MHLSSAPVIVNNFVVIEQLDIYYPLTIASTTPILIFIYGGGFTKGCRSSPPSHLVYTNLGYFFASRGIITVIPDYRLLPDARYPDGSEDVAAAFRWVLPSDSSSSFKERCGDCKERALWAIGHSAGGIHLVTMMLLPYLFNLEISRALKGVVIMGTPFEVSNGKFPFRSSAQTYYGSPSFVGSRQPISLLRDAKTEHLQTFPKGMWSMVAGSEPKRIKSAHTNFARVYRERGGMVDEWVMEGHDHMSPVLALGSGVGEEWGEEVIKWIFSFSLSSLSTD